MNQVPLNPFIPHQPVKPDEFVGRSAEIFDLEQCLSHAKNGTPRHFLLTGDRGIGKTSLMDYLRSVGRSVSSDQKVNFDFLVADIILDKYTTTLEFIRKIERAISRELEKTEPARAFLSKAWEFLNRVEAVGVSVRSSPTEVRSDTMLRVELAHSLINISNRVCQKSDYRSDVISKQYDGILIIVDEADQAPKDLALGAFLKTFLETLHRERCTSVMFGLTGLPTAVDRLLEGHRSSLRLFHQVRLGCLRKIEVIDIIDQKVLDIRNQGVSKFDITDAAKEVIWMYSDGHPHFVQQLGYCAFEAALNSVRDSAVNYDREFPMDFCVQAEHVHQGALHREGAIQIMGDIYFEAVFRRLSKSNEKLLILRQLVESDGFELPRSEIKCLPETNDVDNELLDLCDSGLIIEDRLTDCYKIRYASFAYWLSTNTPGIVP
ncbi:MAG: hypothetical protein DHS20C11_19830 [Lysobacteraceae bacterium]|nr:MAG: hypothetical protein DHS20C11_19830 [Xanthomonadaceae bacterium]